MRISDWSSDVCSSDLLPAAGNTCLNILNYSEAHEDLLTNDSAMLMRKDRGKSFHAVEIQFAPLAMRCCCVRCGRNLGTSSRGCRAWTRVVRSSKYVGSISDGGGLEPPAIVGTIERGAGGK